MNIIGLEKGVRGVFGGETSESLLQRCGGINLGNGGGGDESEKRLVLEGTDWHKGQKCACVCVVNILCVRGEFIYVC
jgi:hypothetical protein